MNSTARSALDRHLGNIFTSDLYFATTATLVAEFDSGNMTPVREAFFSKGLGSQWHCDEVRDALSKHGGEVPTASEVQSLLEAEKAAEAKLDAAEATARAKARADVQVQMEIAVARDAAHRFTLAETQLTVDELAAWESTLPDGMSINEILAAYGAKIESIVEGH